VDYDGECLWVGLRSRSESVGCFDVFAAPQDALRAAFTPAGRWSGRVFGGVFLSVDGSGRATLARPEVPRARGGLGVRVATARVGGRVDTATAAAYGRALAVGAEGDALTVYDLRTLAPAIREPLGAPLLATAATGGVLVARTAREVLAFRLPQALR
jgi:hypothetical protein